MKVKTQSRIVVFVLAFAVWLALTRGGGLPEALAGLAAAAAVSLAAARFQYGFPRVARVFRRSACALLYGIKFLWEMVKANLHVAYIVLHPGRPIRPGVVRIRTGLTRDTAVTVLANSITLTPGTLTIDVDPEIGELCVHCITVNSPDVDRNSASIGGRFERILKEVFE